MTHDTTRRLALILACGLILALTTVAPGQPAAETAAPATQPASTAPVDTTPVDLRPRWQIDQAVEYQLSNTRTISTITRINQQPAGTTLVVVHVTARITWQVEQLRLNGSYTCILTIPWMVIQVVDDQGQTKITDSRKELGDDPDLHKMVRAMTGVPLRCRVAADGTVLQVTGVQEIKQRFGPVGQAPEESDFIEMASDLAALPAVPGPLPVGGTWNNTQRWNHESGYFDATVRYQIDKREDLAGQPAILLSAAAKAKYLPDPARLATPKAKVDMRLVDHSMRSQVIFDPIRSEAISRHMQEERRFETRVQSDAQNVFTLTTETIQAHSQRVEKK